MATLEWDFCPEGERPALLEDRDFVPPMFQDMQIFFEDIVAP